MFLEILGFIFFIIGIMLLMFLYGKKDTFLSTEAKRYFSKNNEIDSSWHSHGRVYTEGIALIEDKQTNQKRFIKQAELCDIGIMS
jgi:hypothetical protein